ncbi:hypothetical protein GGR54DRAFT_555938 [Hypoxylon sp. NC1633]|nr:hypothetical protein GGR54DRAFT_555938 [Hypoxylon sp. NC1633]
MYIPTYVLCPSKNLGAHHLLAVPVSRQPFLTIDVSGLGCAMAFKSAGNLSLMFWPPSYTTTTELGLIFQTVTTSYYPSYAATDTILFFPNQWTVHTLAERLVPKLSQDPPPQATLCTFGYVTPWRGEGHAPVGLWHVACRAARPRLPILLPILLYFLGRSCGSVIASATVPITRSIDLQPPPLPTPPPLARLETRDQSDTNKTCAYYNGDPANPYTCGDGQKCMKNDGYKAIGCVSSGPNGDAVPGASVKTFLYDYRAYLNGSCETMGYRTGCCSHSDHPFAFWGTLTGSVLAGYTLPGCVDSPGHDSTTFLVKEILTTADTTSASNINKPVSSSSQTQPQSPSQSPSPSQAPVTQTNQSKGLSTSDKITLGVGLPATIAGVIAAWYTFRMWQRKKKGIPLDNEGEQRAILVKHPDTEHEVPKEASQVHVTSTPSLNSSV